MAERHSGFESDEEAARRRRLIKYVIVVAILVPVVVEGLTFAGLIGSYFGGGDGGTTPASTATPAGGVSVGDELLAETDAAERVTAAAVRIRDDGWSFVFTVEVENTGDDPYELRLGAVATDAGRRVEGTATTGRVEPNATETVTGRWSIPSGSQPTRVAVTAVEYGSNGTTTLVDREVPIGTVPVQG
ncbi:MAG: hypothetical protein ABEJ40_09015 [Haloarculaceae archaeon]